MNHRKDVEGLRAIAILLVVASHVGLPGLAGGFIGVDVFFVLSGFLITGLLVSEHQRTGKLDLMRFYSRRFRRLLPALALMLLLTGWLATQLIPITQQPEHALAGITAALWLSNLHFAFSTIDYFAAHDSLYLHTWSLGVEEQFYLIWPLLVAFSLSTGVAGGRRTRALMISLAAASLAACLAFSWSSTLLAFYLMPMRVWQFALGALVWLYFVKGKAGSSLDEASLIRLSTISAWSGLLLIFTAASLLNSDTRYPGLWALLPTLGTCLVLASGSMATPASIPIRALSQPPMQWLGRMSYGWYLWHWPLLVLGASVFDMSNGRIRLALVGCALAIAWLSYHLIEQPVRRARRWPFTPLKTILLSLAVMSCLAALGFRWMESAIKNASEWSSNHVITVPQIYAMDCDRWYHSADLTPCIFEPETSHTPPTVVLMGDSIGLQWFPAFSRLAQKYEWRLVVLTKSSCAIVDEPFYYQRIGREYTECSLWRQAALSYIAELNPKAVVIGSSASYDFNKEQWTNGSRRVLARLSAVADNVGILRATPVLPFSGDVCMSFHTPLRDWLAQNSRCTAPAANAQHDAVIDHLRVAAQTLSNVSIIDMNDAVCPHGLCQAERDGVLTYRDTQHLNAEFVENLAAPLDLHLREAMPDLFVER